MNKKKLLKIILVISILIIFCLIVLIINIKQKSNITNTNNIIGQEKPEETYSSIKEKYECNEFELNITSTENLIKTYFYNYKKSMFNYPEEAYNKLDQEYKEKKFGNIDNFKKYISDNFDELKKSFIQEYKIIKENDYTEYIFKDDKDNYYIFRETSIMQYEVMLDNYTIESNEFIKKYNDTTQEGKTLLNIDKLFKSINNKDYTFAYNLLSSNFKNNYFVTQESFEKYIKSTFYNKNEIEYVNFSEVSGLYQYEVIVKNKEDSTQSITKTFIIKLNEGTDFELSFNVE